MGMVSYLYRLRPANLGSQRLFCAMNNSIYVLTAPPRIPGYHGISPADLACFAQQMLGNQNLFE